MGATITCDMSEWEAMKQRIVDAEKARAEAEQKLLTEMARDPSERFAGLLEGWRAALQVVRFTVGNLHPEFVRVGWPKAEISVIAKTMLDWPGATPDDISFATDLEAFVKEIEVYVKESPR